MGDDLAIRRDRRDLRHGLFKDRRQFLVLARQGQPFAEPATGEIEHVFDQRGRPRIIGAACDIGAYEYDAGDIFTGGFE